MRFPGQWIIELLGLQETTKCSDLPIRFLGHRWPINGGCKEVKEHLVVRVRCREVGLHTSVTPVEPADFCSTACRACSACTCMTLSLLHLEQILRPFRSALQHALQIARPSKLDDRISPRRQST